MAKQKTQSTPAPQTTDSGVERLRIDRAFQLSVVGLFMALFILLVLLWKGFDNSSDIVAIVGLFTSVLGTLVGAFFGLQIGSADKARAEERADRAQSKVDILQAAADGPTIKRARELYPDLFK